MIFALLPENRSGPGLNPWIRRAPRKSAETALPGIPKVRRGTNDPPTHALFEASLAMIPSTMPVPNFSGCLDLLLASL